MESGQEKTDSTKTRYAGNYRCPECGAAPGFRCTFKIFKRFDWHPDFFHTSRLVAASEVRRG